MDKKKLDITYTDKHKQFHHSYQIIQDTNLILGYNKDTILFGYIDNRDLKIVSFSPYKKESPRFWQGVVTKDRYCGFAWELEPKSYSNIFKESLLQRVQSIDSLEHKLIVEETIKHEQFFKYSWNSPKSSIRKYS
jgi:hypothetical protein